MDAAFLFVTRTCNLACEHCYVDAGPGLRGHMAMRQFRKIVETLGNAGISDIRLTGGEPTVHPRFRELLTVLNGRGLYPRLNTNGVTLMKAIAPENVLAALSGCWISVYGITEAQHQAVGKGALSLETILAFVGKHDGGKTWVGVSASLTEVDYDALVGFFRLARRHRVRRLRFLFAEPMGRARETGTTFGHGIPLRREAVGVRDMIASLAEGGEFDQVTLNDPFDLRLKENVERGASCLLNSRRMWAFSPEGTIYSCCFNIGRSAHEVGSIDDADVLGVLGGPLPGVVYSARCEALVPEFWGGATDERSSCPISVVRIRG